MNQPAATKRTFVEGIIALAACIQPVMAVDFRSDILPILAENCFHCHGPDAAERKAELRLDVSDGRKDWKTLLGKISSTNPDEVMPPPKSGRKLTVVQVESLRSWIEAGANYETHWAFQPIEEHSAPSLDHRGLTEIDRFIVASLKKRGLALSKPLAKTKLIRRATFDLTGLPPTWKDVQDFLADSDSDAFAKVVDRLLNSPAYGERWGRHWLDLARYADTHGGSAIGFKRFPFSYTYRDYVIAAFNRDLPYDRFILEQLAADQLKLDANDPALAALGFLTVGRQYRNRHDRLDDQIDVISRGLLGLTVACARCHDHKSDPIPTTDYYALHASLAASGAPLELPLVGEPEVDRRYADELKRRKRLRDDIVREQGDVMRGRLRMQVGLYLRELAKGTPEQDTSTTFLSYRTEDLRPVVLERWRSYLAARNEKDPVFGPWHQLSKLGVTNFQSRCLERVSKFAEENGDPKKFADEHRLATKPPKWNPRIVESLLAKKPKSFIEVAEVYGSVFADVHRRWLTSLLEASAEAEPGTKTIPDQDPRHRVVNSAIERQLRHHLYDPKSPTSLVFDDYFHQKMLNRGVRDSVRGTLTSIHSLNLGGNAPPRAMALGESSEERQAFVFRRGSPINRGEPVTARFLSIVSETDAPAFAPGRRRLGLAQAILDPANPLSRRVIVNWVWQHHFGVGLVRTPDDFGTRGDPPTHPKLLDHLASQLLKDDWSLKQLHRRIMLSRVYQQGSLENRSARERDPDNRLLWRMPVRRLEMEAMRDAMLAVSGELNLDDRTGGKPFEEKGNRMIPRRSIYAFVNRDVISRMASTFDGADPSACTVKRPETMVPQQTLYALNSEYVQDRAKALIQRSEIRDVTPNEERARRIYQRVYSRNPGPDEIRSATRFIEQAAKEHDGWVQLAHALLAANEFHFID